MYLKPDYLSIVYQHNDGVPHYSIIKTFGSTEVYCGKHMFKQDAVDWCWREYFGVPIYHS